MWPAMHFSNYCAFALKRWGLRFVSRHCQWGACVRFLPCLLVSTPGLFCPLLCLEFVRNAVLWTAAWIVMKERSPIQGHLCACACRIWRPDMDWMERRSSSLGEICDSLFASHEAKTVTSWYTQCPPCRRHTRRTWRTGHGTSCCTQRLLHSRRFAGEKSQSSAQLPCCSK